MRHSHKDTPVLFLAWTLSLLLLLGIWGCEEVDTTPDPFSFTALTNVAPDTACYSDEITVTGIEAEADIFILDGSGMYSVNGGPFTGTDGTVKEGDTVIVRLVSSHAYNTMVATELAIGCASAVFSVTTSKDSFPDAFAFTPQADVDFDTVCYSEELTVTGIETETVISIQGGSGMYSVNGGLFTGMDGTVYEGDRVVVRLVSSHYYGITSSTELTMGGVSAVFSVTTPDMDSVDVTPDAFDLPDALSGRPDEVFVSPVVISVAGLDHIAPISITGGDAAYSINGGEYTREPGWVANGDQVRVRVTGPLYPGPAYAVIVTVTIGTYSDGFSLTLL